MQHDPLVSQPKIPPLPQEYRNLEPTLSEMRGRYFREEDHAVFLNWVATEVPIELETDWPRGGHSLYFRDPAGNSVELITPGLWGLASGW